MAGLTINPRVTRTIMDLANRKYTIKRNLQYLNYLLLSSFFLLIKTKARPWTLTSQTYPHRVHVLYHWARPLVAKAKMSIFVKVATMYQVVMRWIHLNHKEMIAKYQTSWCAYNNLHCRWYLLPCRLALFSTIHSDHLMQR